MIPRISVSAFIVVLLFAWSAWASESDKEAAALAAAYGWLDQVDEGNYAASWKTAATYFRKVVPQEQWVRTIEGVRMPLGQLRSRTIQNKTYTTTLPGAPDGEYVVIQFNSSFANKKAAMETVTPMRDKDGIWRVSGYYIR